MPTPIKTIHEELVAKQDELRTIFKQSEAKDSDGNDVCDFSAVTGLGSAIDDLEGVSKSVRVAKIVREMSEACNDLHDQVKALDAAEADAKAFAIAENSLKSPRPALPKGDTKGELKSLGQIVTEHPLFAKWMKGSMDGRIVLDMGLAELKTLFQTSAGWSPESTRTGVVVDKTTRPLQVLDIMPTGNTGMTSVVYMEETTRTHNAAELDEGATMAEDVFALTERTSSVRQIGSQIPVTDIQLEDVPAVESYLNGRLNFGVQQRLDQQVISGDGISPNIDGILNVSGIQTQARGADPVPDAIFKAMKKLRVTGRVVPTHALIHPNDWQQIRLLRTSDGIYIWGSPAESGIDRIWGLPVIQAEALTENTGLIGSFQSPWITLFERRGIVIERGFIGDQFKQNKQTIRASGRWALVVYRPAAFCTVTSI